MDKKNILIIEDDLDINALYEKILGEKYNLLINVDAAEGKKKLEKYKVDLIILDFMLPNESGPHFLSALRKDLKYNNIEILLVTTLTDICDSVKKDYSKVTCLSKPFEKDALLGLVEEKINVQG